MQIQLPIKVKWEGKAQSHYGHDTIDKRLRQLEGRTDEAASQERAMLEEFRKKMIQTNKE